MFNHGITAAALFWFIAMIQLRTGGLRGIDDFGGLRKPAPVFAGLMGIALFSSLGLPGLNGFVGEFLIFRGVFPLAWVAATVSVLGLLVTAAVILTVIQKVFTGPVPERWASFPDLHHGERMALAPVIGLMFLLGLVPQLIVDTINPTVAEPAGALEILDVGLDDLHLVCRRAGRGAAAQGQARPGALVRARRGRGRARASPSPASLPAWARAAASSSTCPGCRPWASTTCSPPTASAACWFCSPASPRSPAFSSVGTSICAPTSSSPFISRSSAASTASS